MKLKTMQVNDKILIKELITVFSSQLTHYRELRDLVRKILSRVILSRGDITGVIAGLEKKKKLLDQIEAERLNSSELIAKWQERKSCFEKDGSVAALNSVLDQTESTIREFLDEEEQLKKYIENIIKKECSNTVV